MKSIKQQKEQKNMNYLNSPYFSIAFDFGLLALCAVSFFLAWTWAVQAAVDSSPQDSSFLYSITPANENLEPQFFEFHPGSTSASPKTFVWIGADNERIDVSIGTPNSPQSEAISEVDGYRFLSLQQVDQDDVHVIYTSREVIGIVDGHPRIDTRTFDKKVAFDVLAKGLDLEDFTLRLLE